MEELQMEMQLDKINETAASPFAAVFINPLQVTIENKFRFENLFDFPVMERELPVWY